MSKPCEKCDDRRKKGQVSASVPGRNARQHVHGESERAGQPRGQSEKQWVCKGAAKSKVWSSEKHQATKGFSEQPWTQSLSLLVNFSHQLIFSSVLLSVLESLMMEHYGRLLKAVGHRGNQSRIKRCQRFRFNDSAHSS